MLLDELSYRCRFQLPNTVVKILTFMYVKPKQRAKRQIVINIILLGTPVLVNVGVILL